VHKSLYFLLSHEFSPDGELFCEYIMLQICKSIFCYIELTLNNIIRGVFSKNIYIHRKLLLVVQIYKYFLH